MRTGGARPGLVGLDEISDFEWRLALGDGSVPLSQDDLDELAHRFGSADVWPMTPLQRGLHVQSELAGDDGPSAVRVGISGVPETFLVDGQGIVRRQYIGDIRADQVEAIAAAVRDLR